MILPELVEEHLPEGGVMVLVASLGAEGIVVEEIDGGGSETDEAAETADRGQGGTEAWTKR